MNKHGKMIRGIVVYFNFSYSKFIENRCLAINILKAEYDGRM